MKKLIVLLTIGMLCTGCAKKNAPAPESSTDTSAAAASEGTNSESVTERTHANMNMNMGGGNDDAAVFTDPIDYLAEALGTYTWTISTDSDQAQDYFNQGMQLRWAYNVNEAARSMAGGAPPRSRVRDVLLGRSIRSRLVPKWRYEQTEIRVRASGNRESR